MSTNKNQKKPPFWFYIVFFGMIFFIGKCMFSGSDEPTKPSKITARIDSERYVEKYLKSPSTADFPLGADGCVKINDSTFFVSSYVDSQNGFGAMIRTTYSCQINYVDNYKKVSCTDLVIGGQKVQ